MDGQGQERGELLMLYDVTEVHNLAQFREDLVHMMVHDLRNPLTIAQGSLELLADESFTTLDATAKQLVDMVQHSTQQCLDLVQKILDLQQLESGKLVLEPEDVALLPYVTEQVLQMRPLAGMKRQELLVDVDPTLPPLKADPRLEGRSTAAAADPAESNRQRHQVHARWGHHPHQRRPPRRYGRDRGGGHRPRNTRGAAQGPL
jgi:signal transduction histidine kinase